MGEVRLLCFFGHPHLTATGDRIWYQNLAHFKKVLQKQLKVKAEV